MADMSERQETTDTKAENSENNKCMNVVTTLYNALMLYKYYITKSMCNIIRQNASRYKVHVQYIKSISTERLMISLVDKKHQSTMFKTENFTALLFCKEVKNS